jgi:hypothetical protein
VATELRHDPDLAAVVRVAFERARESGELSRGPFPPLEPSIPAEAAKVIAEWLRDGEYDAAIDRIAAEDPDLANPVVEGLAVVIDDRSPTRCAGRIRLRRPGPG